jgi:hypothetical protein
MTGGVSFPRVRFELTSFFTISTSMSLCLALVHNRCPFPKSRARASSRTGPLLLRWPKSTSCKWTVDTIRAQDAEPTHLDDDMLLIDGSTPCAGPLLQARLLVDVALCLPLSSSSHDHPTRIAEHELIQVQGLLLRTIAFPMHELFQVQGLLLSRTQSSSTEGLPQVQRLLLSKSKT